VLVVSMDGAPQASVGLQLQLYVAPTHAPSALPRGGQLPDAVHPAWGALAQSNVRTPPIYSPSFAFPLSRHKQCISSVQTRSDMSELAHPNA
jgi:hypothetical protein